MPSIQSNHRNPTGAFLAGAVLIAATAITDAEARTSQKRLQVQDLCAAAVDRQEARHAIPKKLLQAISLVESGRWDPKTRRTVAWPWTVTAKGEGRFFPTKQAAIAHVRKLKDSGVRVIDVGCMQVNLHYHPDAFATLRAAFDPKRNADYAARFLTTLKREHGNWRKAVQHYHSATPAKRVPYQNKVYTAWQDTKRRAARP
ncbi:MAG: lytic transglycosylase domain-containing protein, partial [Desulfuromonadales bacterium]|nr:lytic transglycosylase domain-containing protein [Desulfuromonadales bacterium]